MTIVVDQERYDELLHKEATLDNIKRLHDSTTSYAFHDIVGYLFKSEKMEKTDE